MNRALKKITKKLSVIADVKAIILYGSYARGEYTSRSDIDLFIITSNKSAMGQIQDKIIELENTIDRNIQPTIRTIKELQKTDTGLLQNIFQEGKLLYLKESTEMPSAMLLAQKPYLIYSFHLSSLNQNTKAKFNNSFYGRVKNKYKYPGFLNGVNGQKISSGCVIVPHSKKAKVEKFFKKFKVKFKQIKVWK